MTKKILLFNNFPFHMELIGFALDYAKDKDIIVDIFNPIDNLNYFDLYKIYFKYNVVKLFNSSSYDLIIVLTDSDWSFKPEWVTKNTITLNHFYQKRNFAIPNQINCSPFHFNSYEENFIIPTYNLSDINLETKRKISCIDHINIVLLGRFLYDSLEPLTHLKSNKITFHIINVHGIHDCYKNKPNIKVYGKINTLELFNVLLNSQYLYVTDLNYNHTNGYSTSASIALSFNTGCQLIIPKRMNQHLRLKSAILYEPDEDVYLQHLPNYELVFKEKQYFIDMRNKILDSLLL